MKKSCKYEVLKSSRTVFRARDIAILTGENNPNNLKSKISYCVSTGVLKNVRRGIYVKEGYSQDELACRVNVPSYISCETVLARAGVIFQYSSVITAVSYLSRTVAVDQSEIKYRKLKDSILVDGRGVMRQGNINVATPARAFLDMLYLSKDFYFDNINSIDRESVKELLDIYGCKQLEKRVRRLFSNDGR